MGGGRHPRTQSWEVAAAPREAKLPCVSVSCSELPLLAILRRQSSEFLSTHTASGCGSPSQQVVVAKDVRNLRLFPEIQGELRCSHEFPLSVNFRRRSDLRR